MKTKRQIEKKMEAVKKDPTYEGPEGAYGQVWQDALKRVLQSKHKGNDAV